MKFKVVTISSSVSVYLENYDLLFKIIDQDSLAINQEIRNIKPLNISIEKIRHDDSGIIISIAEYKRQNGDLMVDLDLLLKVNQNKGYVEAISLQNQFGFRSVYLENDTIDIEARDEINKFLHRWLQEIVRELSN